MGRTIHYIGSAIGNCGHINGCEMAPYSVINALATDASFVDCCTYFYNSQQHNQQELRNYFIKIASQVNLMLHKNAFPILLGGDHSCAIGTWSGVAAYLQTKGEELSLIWIDAHLDAHRPDSSPSGNLHGMPVAHLLGNGFAELTTILTTTPKLKAENLVYFGIRSFEAAEEENLKNLGVKIYYQEMLTEANFGALFAHEFARLAAKTQRVGISLDLDGLAASEFTAVGTPVAGGMSGAAFLAALHLIDFNKLIAFELAEYNPQLDATGNSMAFVLQLVKYITQRVNHDA